MLRFLMPLVPAASLLFFCKSKNSQTQVKSENTQSSNNDYQPNTYFAAALKTASPNANNLNIWNEANKKWLQEMSQKDAAPAEKWSALHQLDLLALVDGFPNGQETLQRKQLEERLRLVGLVVDEFRLGVYETDKGKAQAYKDLFLKASDKSDLLLSTMKLEEQTTSGGLSNKRAVQALKLILQGFGFVDNGGNSKPILNAKLSNDQIRKLFEGAPFAGWLHEWPGLADSIELLCRNFMNEDQFRTVVSIAMFHNGPEAGYWQKMTQVFVGGALKGLEAKHPAIPNGKNLFDQTIFDKDVTENSTTLAYAIPVTFPGIIHVILDRLSQATRGGVIKIWHEIQGFSSAAGMVKELVFEGPLSTIDQLNVLAAHVDAIAAGKIPTGRPFTPAQIAEIKNLISGSVTRIIALTEQALQDIRVTSPGGQVITPVPGGQTRATVQQITEQCKDVALCKFELIQNAEGKPFQFLADAKNTEHKQIARKTLEDWLNKEDNPREAFHSVLK